MFFGLPTKRQSLRLSHKSLYVSGLTLDINEPDCLVFSVDGGIDELLLLFRRLVLLLLPLFPLLLFFAFEVRHHRAAPASEPWEMPTAGSDESRASS